MFSLGVLTAWLLWLAITNAQQMIQPSNSTSPPAKWNDTQLILSFKQEGSLITYGLDVAINPWPWGTPGLNMSPNSLTNMTLSGTIMATSPFTTNNLTQGDIAYLSCDPQSYNGSNLGPDQTMKAATGMINGGQDSGNNAGAIVLYSTSSIWCNFTPPDSYTYKNVFILPQVMPAAALERTLKAPNATVLNGQILFDQSSMSNGTGNYQNSDDLGPTPTTTVAMIILYSVTGIITLCFIVVIVIGAVRAHRHPDRYGLLNLPGGAHQRRARALARAMLDTIPIVKFGERTPAKPTDPENGTELGTRQPEPQPGSQRTTSTPNVGGNETAREENAAEAPTDNSTPQQTNEDAAEAGLACSVCTEDFVKGQDTRVLPCNHKFHPECIDPWLLNVSGTCPLCRVDLHAPESGDEQPAEGEEVHEPTTNADSHPRMGPAGTPIYRPLRFSTFLTPRRMRHATPEQRLRALRDFRNARRASNSDDSPETPRVPRIRGTRLTRLFRRETTSTASASEVPPVPSQPEPQQQHQEQSTQPFDYAASRNSNEQTQPSASQQ